MYLKNTSSYLIDILHISAALKICAATSELFGTNRVVSKSGSVCNALKLIQAFLTKVKWLTEVWEHCPDVARVMCFICLTECADFALLSYKIRSHSACKGSLKEKSADLLPYGLQNHLPLTFLPLQYSEWSRYHSNFPYAGDKKKTLSFDSLSS